MDLKTQIVENYRAIKKYHALIRFMALKDMKVNVVDTVLGKLWLLLDPLSHMLIYYFIIVVIFNAGPRLGINPFVFLMMGISHYLFFSSTITVSGISILSKQSFIMQLKIEPLVFIWIDYYKSCINFAIMFTIYLVFYLTFGPQIPPNVIYYPLLLAVLFLFTYSLSVIAASTVIILRDMRQVVAISVRILMYASPVIYSIDFVPQRFREIYLYNPLACLFSLFHWSVFDAPYPPNGPICSMVAFSIALFILAHYFYNTLKVHFTKLL